MNFFGKCIIGLLLVLLIVPKVKAQEVNVTYATIVDGDTLPYYKLKLVIVRPASCYLTPEEIRKNKKLIRNVKKMLPYAQLGKSRLDQLEAEVAELPKRQRKEYIKKAEKDLLAEFGDELKHFTFSQGRVLLKLVDRETGRTSYVLVNELRGKLRAGFYQTFAKLFGYNLKNSYNPKGDKEDALIERIVLSIEAGLI